MIVEHDIEDPNLRVPFVRGINSELHDNMRDFSDASTRFRTGHMNGAIPVTLER